MDDQRTDRKGGGMNWLTKQRHFRFGLRSLLIAFAMIALCVSAYKVGHELGAKDGFKLGYNQGVLAADEDLMRQIKEQNDLLSAYTSAELEAYKEREIRKLEARKKSNPTP